MRILRNIGRFGLASLAFVALAAVPASAQQAAPQPSTYIALALSDGPTADQRLVIAVRGAHPHEIVTDAYRACYERAAQGYMHTCQVWYGDAWVVGAMCVQPGGTAKFAIGDDATSPEGALTKAIAVLRDKEKADISNCRSIAEYSANDVQTGLSAAKDKQ